MYSPYLHVVVWHTFCASLALGLQVLLRQDAPAKQGDSLVIGSSSGATSHQGCGIRQMALMMDLRELGMRPDMLTQSRVDESELDWNSAEANAELSQTRLLNVEEHAPNVTAMIQLLEQYERIFFFGWVWDLERMSNLTVEALELASLKDRVTLLLDDNLLARCYEPTEELCRARAPAQLARWLNVSYKAAALTAADAGDINKYTREHGIEGPMFEIWPMRLEQVHRLFANATTAIEADTDLIDGCDTSQDRITIVANHNHATKTFFRDAIDEGAFERMCAAIDAQPGHKLKIWIVGLIGDWIKLEFKSQLSKLGDCVLFLGDVSGNRLMNEVFPRTLAVLNPIPPDLGSGISVKTYQAVALQLPLITSEQSFRGLEACATRLNDQNLLTLPDPKAYADFVITHLLDREAACEFQQAQKKIMGSCLVSAKEEQMQQIIMASSLGRAEASIKKVLTTFQTDPACQKVKPPDCGHVKEWAIQAYCPQYNMAYAKVAKANSKGIRDRMIDICPGTVLPESFFDFIHMASNESDFLYAFTFVREPFSRVVSGYTEVSAKCEYKEECKKVCKNAAFSWLDHGHEPKRFELFLDDYSQGRIPEACAPTHVTPQIKRVCGVPTQALKAIGMMEHFYHQMSTIENSARSSFIGKPEKLLAISDENLIGEEEDPVDEDAGYTRIKEIDNEAASRLATSQTRRLVCKMYEADYKCFGYPLPQECLQ